MIELIYPKIVNYAQLKNKKLSYIQVAINYGKT